MGLIVICLPSAPSSFHVCVSLPYYSLAVPEASEWPTQAKAVGVLGLGGLSSCAGPPYPHHRCVSHPQGGLPEHPHPSTYLCFALASCAWGGVTLCLLLYTALFPAAFPGGGLRVGIACILFFTQPLTQGTLNTGANERARGPMYLRYVSVDYKMKDYFIYDKLIWSSASFICFSPQHFDVYPQ